MLLQSEAAYLIFLDDQKSSLFSYWGDSQVRQKLDTLTDSAGTVDFDQR